MSAQNQLFHYSHQVSPAPKGLWWKVSTNEDKTYYSRVKSLRWIKWSHSAGSSLSGEVLSSCHSHTGRRLGRFLDSSWAVVGMGKKTLMHIIHEARSLAGVIHWASLCLTLVWATACPYCHCWPFSASSTLPLSSKLCKLQKRKLFR